jgi:hypothetical protein
MIREESADKQGDSTGFRAGRESALRAQDFLPQVIWAGCALTAVSLALLIVLAVQGRSGAKFGEPGEVVALRAINPVKVDEIAGLRATIGALEAERAALLTRIDVLESMLGDRTGTVTASPKPAAKWEPPPFPYGLSLRQQTTPATSHTAERARNGDPATSSLIRSEFAIDLGAEATLDGLRARWASLRGNHAVLEGLQPLARLKDGGKPGQYELRLIAGPLGNAVAAARICAGLKIVSVTCTVAQFDGQQLGLR